MERCLDMPIDRQTAIRDGSATNIGMPKPTTAAAAYCHSISDTLSALRSSPDGLSRAEAEDRLRRFGRNSLPAAATVSLLEVFLRQFLSPLIYILLVAGVVSLALGERTDAIFIFAVLLINALIGTIQEFHAARSAEALRRMVTSVTQVVREGESVEVDSEEIVPGDIVVLTAGARAPADMRLTHCLGLQIDESLLTGESAPVDKNADCELGTDTAVADRLNMAFAGSMINRGRGTGVVVGTGIQTEVGKLADSLAERKEPKAPLIQRMESFTVRIAMALGVIVVALAAIKLAQGAGWHEVFIVSVALAVSAIPEGLPVAVTVALAIGMRRMAKRNVIVRKLVAVEALGSCTLIASDKTGTLTLNELTCRQLSLPGEEAWYISGEGIVPEGKVVSPTGELNDEQRGHLQRLAEVAALCNEGFLGLRDGEWATHGDAVDAALLVMAHKVGVVQAPTLERFPLRESIPYESELGFAATLHTAGDNHRICVKGAFESLLPMCELMATPAGEVPIDPAALREASDKLAAAGGRVLAFADRIYQPKEPLEFAENHLHKLTLLGFVGMIDPLRPESKGAVAACRESGLEVAMVTGDHPRTARAIANDLGLMDADDAVLTGREIKALHSGNVGEEAMDKAIGKARIFARVEPRQKLDIVDSFARQGHFVAVTGDGVNDAPALASAHAGVAMGDRGTDVARESAHLILTDDNFASITNGIEEGRIAYRNIRKVTYLLISTGAAEVVMFILAMIAGLPLPLTAVQLLWLNLVTNGIQDVSLAFEPGEGDEMKQPPRPPKEPIFNRIMIERVLVGALVMGGMAFGLFWTLIQAGIAVASARNSVLLLMVLFENVHIGNCRSETLSAFSLNPLRNPLLLFGTIVAQLIHISALYLPGISTVLETEPVSFAHWINLFALALSVLAAMEIQKLIWSRRNTKSSRRQ